MPEQDQSEELVRRSQRLFDEIAKMLRDLGVDAEQNRPADRFDFSALDIRSRCKLLVAIHELEEVIEAMIIVKSSIAEHILQVDRNRSASGAYLRTKACLQPRQQSNRH
jgi:hypothetical protein